LSSSENLIKLLSIIAAEDCWIKIGGILRCKASYCNDEQESVERREPLKTLANFMLFLVAEKYFRANS
jgi:hypothetical protein